MSFALSEMLPVDLPSVSVASAVMVSALKLNLLSFVSAFSSIFLSFSSLSIAFTLSVFVTIVISPMAVMSAFSRFSSYLVFSVDMLTFCVLMLRSLSFMSAPSLSCATMLMCGDCT